MISRSTLSRSIAAAFGTSLIALAPMAMAQQSLEKVTVTGSNIKRTDAETASPVQVITREDIEKSGKQTISDVIRSLPVDNNGSISQGFESGFAAGASGVSLRGLGVNSTLVLINGRRTAPYGLADDGQRNFVDLSSIPLDAVERVEIVKDGASAIYGSDAIAGVINIILRKDFKGISTNVSYGQSRYSDGTNIRGSITAGFGDIAEDRYNIFANLEVSKQEEIWQKDRGGRKWVGNGDLAPYGYDWYDGYVRGWYNPDYGVTPNPFGLLRNPATGLYEQLPGCNSSIALPEGAVGCLYDLTKYTQIQPKEDKLNLFVRGTLDISQAVQPFAEFGYYKSKVSTSITPASVSSTWPDALNYTIKSNSGITLPGNHPDNPFGAAARLRYLTDDVGPRRNDYDTDVLRLVAGSKGTVGAWDYDTAVMYAESKTKRTANGYIRNSVLRELLAGTGPLGFYRIGDDAHLNSPELYAALSPTLVNNTKTSVTSIDGKVSTEIAQLEGGALAVSFGGELRREKLNSPATPYTDEADIVGLGYSAFDSARTVSAVFAELNAPVLKNLELNAALRNDHYSDYGNSLTPKLGAKWTPLNQVVVRGTYAEGFRAPGAAENGNSSTAGYTTYYDPVRCPVTDLGTDCGSGQLVVITAGNPDVKPEKSKSYTFGIVLEPTTSTSVSIDWWKISRRDEINAADPNTILANPLSFPNAVIIRDDNNLPGVPNSGTVLAVAAPYVNTSKTETSGIDIDLRQRFALGEYGKLTADFKWTYLSYFEKTLEDGTTIDYAGTHGPTALSGNAGTPRNRATFVLTWEQGPLTVASQLNYISGMKNVEFQGDENGCLNHFADGSDAPGNCHVASFTTVDLYGNYKINKQLDVYGSVLNLFDRIAPLDPQTYGGINYNPTYHLSGAIGRYFQVGMKYRF